MIDERRDQAEAALIPGAFVLAAALSLNGPFFPVSLVHPQPRADTRRCSLAQHAAQSDCALIGSQWVVTTAGSVAAARPVGGRIHVRIGDEDYMVDQLVYHPKWNGGSKYDVTLLKLTERVPSFPLLPPPGESPANVERVAQRALAYRDWVSQNIGASPLWDDRNPNALVARQTPLLTRVKLMMDAWAGRTTNE